MKRRGWVCAATILISLPSLAWAAGPASGIAPGAIDLSGVQQGQLAPYVRLLIGLSLLSLIPVALVAMTSFTRIVITLSFVRHALGMPETPPNMVLITLAMLLTFFTMAPTLEQSYREGLSPFLEGKASPADAFDRGVAPLKAFMSAHVRATDVEAVSELAHVPATDARGASDASHPRATDALTPTTDQAAPTPLRVLVPAFMLSELRAAFVAGFVIFLPFLLIDLTVAAILMALGMMMVPPVSISLPLKVMLFVLIDGWSLLLRAIAGVYS